MTGQTNLADGYNNRAIANHRLGKNEASMADYAKAIELNPASARFFTNRGNLYSDLKRFDEAIADYTKAIALDPAYAAAYEGRGIANGTKQDFEAIEDFPRSSNLTRPTRPHITIAGSITRKNRTSRWRRSITQSTSIRTR